jgi:AcrR family transcriptional regulator
MNEQRREERVQEAASHGPSRGEKRREDLVLAAYHVLAQRGFEGLRVREVAAQAGVNIATLHYYFPTKEALVQGVVAYLLHQFLNVTAPVLGGSEETPAAQLKQVFLDFQYQLEHEPEIFLVMNELHLVAPRNPAVFQALEQLNRGWSAHIESVCAQGVQQGLFRADLDAHRAASLIIALIKGMSLQAVSHLDTFESEQIGTLVVRSFLQSEA